MTVYETAALFLNIIGTLALPIIGFILATAKRSRDEILVKVTHLDECIDSLRSTVQGKGVTREDLERFRAENNEMMSRMRSAISNEMHGLHDRIMRLENVHFRSEEHR